MYTIDGIEIDLTSTLDGDTIDATTTPLDKALAAIRALHQHRGLTTFIIKCTAPCNTDATHASNTIYGVDMEQALPEWELVVEPIHTATLGDPIAETILIVVGCHNSRCPGLFRKIIHPRTSPCDTEASITSHLRTDASVLPLQFQYLMYEKVKEHTSAYSNTIPKLIGIAYPAPPGEPLHIYDHHHPCPAITEPLSNVGIPIQASGDPVL